MSDADVYGLAGKRSLVLCGTAGIGYGVARCLARYGSTVTVTGRDAGRAATVAAGLPGRGHSGFACDMREAATVGERVAGTGPYDVVLLNTPGAAAGTVDTLSPAALREAVDLMLVSMAGAVDAVLPGMRKNGWGRLVAITSSALITPISGLAASSVARAAVQVYLKLLAETLGPEGITVNHVLPGKIDTDRLRTVDAATATRTGTDVAAVRAATVRAIPAGRYGTPDDVGELVAFLASERAAYLTGAGIPCDGGFIRSV